jgi:hypothetical protein
VVVLPDISQAALRKAYPQFQPGRKQQETRNQLLLKFTSLEQRPEASDTLVRQEKQAILQTFHLKMEYSCLLVLLPLRGLRLSSTIQSNSLQLRKQGTVVDSPPRLWGRRKNTFHILSSFNHSHSQENIRTQAYPSSVGLHLLPSEPLLCLGRPSI